MRRHRDKDVKKRRKRREKLSKLREKYALAKGEEEKEKILDKVKRIAPWLSVEEFIKLLEQKTKAGN